MAIPYTVYEPSSGEIVKTGICSLSMLALNCPEGCEVLKGVKGDKLTQKVLNSIVVERLDDEAKNIRKERQKHREETVL